MPLKKYSELAIARSRNDALEWLENNGDGYPRTWAQEEANDERRGYIMHDDFCAPPIAGYEALEKEGLVVRREMVEKSGEDRIHFSLKTTGPRSIPPEG